MGGFLAKLGTAQSAGTTTLVLTTAESIPVGAMVHVVVSADSTGVNLPTATIGTVGGVAPTARPSATYQGASGAGAGTAFFGWTVVTTAEVIVGTNITVTFSAAPAKAVIGALALWGVTNTLRGTVVTAVSSAGTPSAVSGGTAPATGDAVLGAIGTENNAAPTADADTLNGSWSTQQSLATTGGGAAANQAMGMQYKFVTAGGAQTYNASGAADTVAVIFALIPDGTNTWTEVASPGFATSSGNIPADVWYDNGTWVVTANAGDLLTSTDAVAWTSRNAALGVGSSNYVLFCRYFAAGGVWVAGGGPSTFLKYSTDNGVSWTSCTHPFAVGAPTRGMSDNGTTAVVVGNGPVVATSPDGITWTSQTTPLTTEVPTDVAYGAGVFVVVASGGKIITSTNGISWTDISHGLGTPTLNRVAYGNGLFVTVGTSGTVWTSPDGATWTSRTSGYSSSYNLTKIDYSNNVWTLGGSLSARSTSTNGTSWTRDTSALTVLDSGNTHWANGKRVTVVAPSATDASTAARLFTRPEASNAVPPPQQVRVATRHTVIMRAATW